MLFIARHGIGSAATRTSRRPAGESVTIGPRCPMSRQTATAAQKPKNTNPE